MNVSIIVFSPSGNTEKAGNLIKNELDKLKVKTELINISRCKEYFLAKTDEEKRTFLDKIVSPHNILIIGAPVYAHHLQYHVIELMNLIPQADGAKWGKGVIPFVTYGGINSGVALSEAGKLLRKSGRNVIAGAKLSYPHHMTKAFMDNEYNSNFKEDEIAKVIKKMADKVSLYKSSNSRNIANKLSYQNIETKLKAKFIFKEKLWHKKRYPKIVIDSDKCIECGKCEAVCPVFHLSHNTDCIHCFNCISICPAKAIYPSGDLEKAKEFMSKMIKKPKESPENHLYI